MNKDKIIETIKFHCEASKKNLLNYRLADKNISEDIIKEIDYSYEYLKKNLIHNILLDLQNNT